MKKKKIEIVKPRKDWKDYYIKMAHTVKVKSKDSSSKVGALIVNPNNEIVSLGFNGFPAGVNEDRLHWEDRPLKYLEVVHAEMNALLFARRDVTGCVVFSTHGPCENCLKHLLAAGIREIYYDDPSIMRDRGTELQKKAIRSLIFSSNAIVQNVNTDNLYIHELRSEGENK